MLKAVDFYYFSPTGGTKKAGAALAFAMAETVNALNLAGKCVCDPCADVVVVAAPVFGGRIPAFVSDKLAKLKGQGKKAVTAVVYGVRAYEDALLELNDVMKSSGFEVIASATLVAQHSIVPEVGADRPDEVDIVQIQQFARCIVKAIEDGKTGAVSVPGNRPYKESKKGTSTPLSLPTCNSCSRCVSVCPTEAIALMTEGVVTDLDACMMCMACVASCPTNARILPPSLQEALTQRMSAFKDVPRENEFYLS